MRRKKIPKLKPESQRRSTHFSLYKILTFLTQSKEEGCSSQCRGTGAKEEVGLLHRRRGFLANVSYRAKKAAKAAAREVETRDPKK